MISQILKYVTTMEEIVVDTMSILKIAKSVNVLILMKVQNFELMYKFLGQSGSLEKSY